MLKDYPEEYKAYMERTGMFLPRSLERYILPASVWGKVLGAVLIAVIAIGGAFALRFYTIRHLDLWSAGNVAALSTFYPAAKSGMREIEYMGKHP